MTLLQSKGCVLSQMGILLFPFGDDTHMLVYPFVMPTPWDHSSLRDSEVEIKELVKKLLLCLPKFQHIRYKVLINT